VVPQQIDPARSRRLCWVTKRWPLRCHRSTGCPRRRVPCAFVETGCRGVVTRSPKLLEFCKEHVQERSGAAPSTVTIMSETAQNSPLANNLQSLTCAKTPSTRVYDETLEPRACLPRVASVHDDKKPAGRAIAMNGASEPIVGALLNAFTSVGSA